MTQETEEKTRARYGWPSIVVAIVFGVLYAYALWTAIGDLIQLPTALGSVTPWWLLIMDVALPVVAYAIAFILGRSHPVFTRALFFFIGATVLSCATVGSIAFIQTH